MPTLDWLNRDAAFRIAERVPTRVLLAHTAGHLVGPGRVLPHMSIASATSTEPPLARTGQALACASASFKVLASISV